ncbi:uncharacterized protein N7496_007883 [Penicillium cataractarum]|uniref:Uncharacterized protein n=1 Tax=Penicillium cataractarum TaxID=2100454 RepID=A0A9W9V415_9EURO|nr:uncharacterized protein N7496_007883 [Penicillium cataractarum]KAJ5368123.1 hypothetical protein N7496_007883 [Penicillium cataractarum]
MTGETLPQGEVIGIVIGAIVLFSIISIVPIMIMWYHRRHAAARTTNEVHDLTSPMHQASVEQWLEEQNTPRDIQRYTHETWYVINLFHFLATCSMYVDPTHVGNIMSWL